jgi:hypothetical protein
MDYSTRIWSGKFQHLALLIRVAFRLTTCTGTFNCGNATTWSDTKGNAGNLFRDSTEPCLLYGNVYMMRHVHHNTHSDPHSRLS